MSKRTITVIVVVVLLAGIGGFNYLIKMDPTQLAARGVGKDAHAHHHDHDADGEAQVPKEVLSEPLGPEGAEVLIQVTYQDPHTLEVVREWLTAVVTEYKPHVRVEFLDPSDAEDRKIMDAASEHLQDGLIINGDVVKEVPGTAFGMVAFTGEPELEHWDDGDLRLAVEHELRQKGVEFTPHVQEEEHEHEHHRHDGEQQG